MRDIRVAIKDSTLWADFEGAPVPLRQVGPSEFEPESPTVMRVTFEPAHGAAPRKLTVLRTLNAPGELDAITEVEPAAAELAAYAGDYWSDELRVTYRLTVTGRALALTALMGADGIARAGTVPFGALRPILADEFDPHEGPLLFQFRRGKNSRVTGFTLTGFLERGILFARQRGIH